MGMNLGALEEWVESTNLPRGVISHLAPVKDLFNWLQVCEASACPPRRSLQNSGQCLSSITEFANLVATIQTMKHLNPLQVCRMTRVIASNRGR